MEELAYPHEVCSGQSDSRGICSGYLFTLARHSRSDQNREYLVVSTTYQAAAEAYETSDQINEMCSCSFTVIPSSVQFRPQRSTPKPTIQGTQTAVVTGPSGEEIYTDEQGHGRVKVQFHWDREGEYDQNTSCWIRVSQVHAGKSFGGIDIPRIGEEVIVSFMEGDPDQPIITGRVYNAESMPPFGLPGKKVVSGMKSNSTPGGGGYNEITMDDTKGKEGLTIHAQYDMNTTVEHDQTITIKSGNRTLGVNTGTNTETIKGNASLTIQAGSRTVSVTGGNYSATASDAIVLHGKGKGVGITGNGKGVSVMGTPDVFVEGKSNVTLKSPVIDIGDKEINIGGTKVVISVGGNSITLDPAGVTIKGALVKIN
jgi:type VI secretion system secreted protein VgrG